MSWRNKRCRLSPKLVVKPPREEEGGCHVPGQGLKQGQRCFACLSLPVCGHARVPPPQGVDKAGGPARPAPRPAPARPLARWAVPGPGCAPAAGAASARGRGTMESAGGSSAPELPPPLPLPPGGEGEEAADSGGPRRRSLRAVYVLAESGPGAPERGARHCLLRACEAEGAHLATLHFGQLDFGETAVLDAFYDAGEPAPRSSRGWSDALVLGQLCEGAGNSFLRKLSALPQAEEATALVGGGWGGVGWSVLVLDGRNS